MRGEIVIVDIKLISSIDIFADKIKQHKNKQIIALTPYVLGSKNTIILFAR